MKRKLSLVLTGVAALSLTIMTSAGAAPIFNVNFNGDEVTDPPSAPSTATAQAGQINTKPTGTSVKPNNSVLVQSSFGDLTDTPVVFTTVSSAKAQLYFDGNSADYDASAVYSLTYDLYISSTGLWNGHVLNGQLRNDNGDTVGQVIFNHASDNNNTIKLYSGNDGKNEFTSVWKPDELIHVEEIIDPTAGTFTVKINNQTEASIAIDTDLSSKGVAGFRFLEGSSGQTATFAVDNIVGNAVVPEPSSMGLLTLGGLLMLRKRK